MIIISDMIQFKNNTIQTLYTASKTKKHIITSIIKNDEEPNIQKTIITESIEELTSSLGEFTTFKEYKENTLFHLKHIDNFISKNINETEINETNFKKIQEIRNKLILSLYENEENKARNEEILAIAKEKNNYIKELFGKDNEINLSIGSEVIKQDKIDSIYKPPSNLDLNKYKYTSEALYCFINYHDIYGTIYLRISRNDEKKQYSYCFSYFPTEINEDGFKHITQEFFTNEPITVDDKKRNKVLGQYTKDKFRFKDELQSIGIELLNTEGFEQITHNFSTYEIIKEVESMKEAEDYDITKPTYDKKIALEIEKNISNYGLVPYLTPYLEKVHLGDKKNIFKKLSSSINVIKGEGSYFSKSSGYSEGGKSLEDEIVYLHMIPEENLFRYNDITYAGLTRLEKDFLSRKIVYLGDLGGKKDFEKVEPIFNVTKTLITEHYYSRLLTDNKQGKGHILQTLEMEVESIGMVFQTVKTDFVEGDDQLLSRTLESTPSKVNDEEISDFIFYCENEYSKQAKDRKKALKELEKMREYLKYLVNQEFKIINPFRRIFKEYSSKSETKRRELKQQMELFRAYCKLTYTECLELENRDDEDTLLLASKKQLNDYFNYIALESVLNPHLYNFLKMLKADGKINELTLIDESDTTSLTPYFNNILEEMGENQKRLDDDYNNYPSFNDLDPKEEERAIRKLMTIYGVNFKRKKTSNDTVFFTITRLRGVYKNYKHFKDIKENPSEVLHQLYTGGFLGKLEYKYRGENIYYLTTKYSEITEELDLDFSEEEIKEELRNMSIEYKVIK